MLPSERSRVICAGDRTAVRTPFPCILPDHRPPSVPKSETLSPKRPLVPTPIHDRRSSPSRRRSDARRLVTRLPSAWLQTIDASSTEPSYPHILRSPFLHTPRLSTLSTYLHGRLAHRPGDDKLGARQRIPVAMHDRLTH